MNKNYLSDFEFRPSLTDCTGKAVDIPQCDWTMLYFTLPGLPPYVVSRKAGVLTNCRIDEDEQLRVIFKGHRLQPGDLHCKMIIDLPDAVYPDGTRRIVHHLETGIELVEGNGDCACDMTVEIMMPYIKGEPFRYEDFTAEQLAALQGPAVEAANRADGAAADAIRAAERADVAADNAYEWITTIERTYDTIMRDEQKRVDAEVFRVMAEDERKASETARIDNEAARQKAEQTRTSQFAELNTSAGTAITTATNAAESANNAAAAANEAVVHLGQIPVVHHTETTVEIAPNVLNVWGVVESLNITLAPANGNYISEYMIEFTSGATATKLTLPESVKFMEPVEVEPNTRNQISILNNIGVIACV